MNKFRDFFHKLLEWQIVSGKNKMMSTVGFCEIIVYQS